VIRDYLVHTTVFCSILFLIYLGLCYSIQPQHRMITHHQNLTATAVQDIPWLNRLVTTQDSPFAASKGKHSRSSKNFPTVPAIDPRQRGNAEDPRLDADKTKGALLSPEHTSQPEHQVEDVPHLETNGKRHRSRLHRSRVHVES
jgi:hypothetical protein